MRLDPESLTPQEWAAIAGVSAAVRDMAEAAVEKVYLDGQFRQDLIEALAELVLAIKPRA